jgi:hypothetical protein
MKPEVREYQEQAAQCLEAAQRALTPEVRQAYLDLMKQLIERAEETAQLDDERSLPLIGKQE